MDDEDRPTHSFQAGFPWRSGLFSLLASRFSLLASRFSLLAAASSASVVARALESLHVGEILKAAGGLLVENEVGSRQDEHADTADGRHAVDSREDVDADGRNADLEDRAEVARSRSSRPVRGAPNVPRAR